MARVAGLLAEHFPSVLASEVLQYVGAPGSWLACVCAREPFALPLPSDITKSWRLATMCRWAAAADDIWAVELFAQALNFRLSGPCDESLLDPDTDSLDTDSLDNRFRIATLHWAPASGLVAARVEVHMPPFTLHPQSHYQPSGHINMSYCRESVLTFHAVLAPTTSGDFTKIAEEYYGI